MASQKQAHKPHDHEAHTNPPSTRPLGEPNLTGTKRFVDLLFAHVSDRARKSEM